MARVGVALADALTVEGTVEVTVRSIAAGGSGIAELPDGRVVFVPRTAPGDRADIRVDRQKARWAVGTLERLVEPGPDRADAPCPLYATCGGCQLQHLTYERQLEWKGRFVADALTRLGGLGPVEPPEVVPSPRALAYRSRISFTLRRLRGGRVVAGLHALGRPAHVIEVRGECVLPEAALAEAWGALRGAWGPGARALPDGGTLRLTLRTVSGGWDLLVEGGGAGWSADELVAALPGLVTLRHRPAGGDARTLHGDPVSAFGFEQVNRAAADALRAHVLDVSGPGPGSAIDAYCGAGAFASGLAELGWTVRGIEIDAEAAAAARAASTAGVGVTQGRVEDLLAGHLPADLLLVNPPRAGLAAAATAAVLAAPPPRIVYVSCDPATLARDLGLLTGAYHLEGLRAFDLFPQTAHVETVAVLAGRGQAA